MGSPMRISLDFLPQLRSLKRNVHAFLCLLFLLIAFGLVFLEIGSILSVMILPFFVLIIPGYFFAKILFKRDDFVDKLLIGYGLSTFNSTVSFYILLFLLNKTIDPSSSRLFLVILVIESLVLILIDYFKSKKSVSRNFKFKVRLENLLAQNHYLLLGILFCTILLGQILLVKIPMYWPDEHTYVYISRNLLHTNYSFTPMPPVMDSRLYIPRYVFIGLNTIFYLFFGLQLTAPQAMVIISSLMLVLATFALTNTLYDKKVGLVASFYIAFNPIFWWMARRVVPDMVVASLLWSGIYFMIKTCKHNGTEIRWQYIPISGLFLGLAIFVKMTILFVIPTFILILIIFRQRISKKRTFLFYMICLTGTISLLTVFLVSERFMEYLDFLLRNFSHHMDSWDWYIVYASMIEPLLIISPVLVFTILGIVFDIKKRGGQSVIILFTVWTAYIFLPLLMPFEAVVDPRHVFPAHVGPSIIAAFGTVEVTKRKKLWERMLYMFLLIFVQVFYEAKIRNYVQISQVSLQILIELFLVILIFGFLSLVLVSLRKAVQKTKLQPSRAASKVRVVVLLGFVLALFVNGHTLGNIMESNSVRRNCLMILSATQTSLEVSGKWLIENTDESSILMTNEFTRLPYYAGFRITYPLPENESSFFQKFQNKNIEYLILFWNVWSPKFIYNICKNVETKRSNMLKIFRWDYPADDDYAWGFVIIYKVIEDSGQEAIPFYNTYSIITGNN